MDYKNYADFVKSGLKAVAVGIAQPEMCLGAVLKKKSFSHEFERAGNLRALCADTGHREQVQSELARVETLEYPFAKETTNKLFQGSWKTKSSGLLGVAVPSTAQVKTWMGSYSSLRLQLYDVTVHYLKEEYLLDIITSGKWKPNLESLNDFYVISEIVLTTRINIRLSGGAAGGAGAQVDIPVEAGVEAGLTYSYGADGTLDICGVMEDGHQKPFAIAFRTARIKYGKGGKVKNMKFGVRRGEDDGRHLSTFVKEDEKYHIGEFFLNIDEDEGVPTIVPISFDEKAGQ